MKHRLRTGIRLPRRRRRDRSKARTPLPIHISTTGLQCSMFGIFDVHGNPSDLRVDRRRRRRREVVLGLVFRFC